MKGGDDTSRPAADCRFTEAVSEQIRTTFESSAALPAESAPPFITNTHLMEASLQDCCCNQVMNEQIQKHLEGLSLTFSADSSGTLVCCLATVSRWENLCGTFDTCTTILLLHDRPNNT